MNQNWLFICRFDTEALIIRLIDCAMENNTCCLSSEMCTEFFCVTNTITSFQLVQKKINSIVDHVMVKGDVLNLVQI